MKWELAEKIAEAVLYEGYLLYPYRPSVVKNRQRWTFGGVYPRAFAEAQTGADAWSVQTECLAVGSEQTPLNVRARFLHLQERTSSDPDGAPQIWQESVEREVTAAWTLGELCRASQVQKFDYPAVCDESGGIVRRQEAVTGSLEVFAAPVGERAFKVTARLVNRTPFADEMQNRDAALLRSLVSAHIMLGVPGGKFVSQMDPPDEFKAAVASCHNMGLYPVLVGDEGEHDMMLASPIILYDYPQIAPESAGDLFDGTEIDEILTLRILTMTDAEKAEARQGDERARALLDRTEALPDEQLMKMHGAMRHPRALEGP